MEREGVPAAAAEPAVPSRLASNAFDPAVYMDMQQMMADDSDTDYSDEDVFDRGNRKLRGVTDELNALKSAARQPFGRFDRATSSMPELVCDDSDASDDDNSFAGKAWQRKYAVKPLTVDGCLFPGLKPACTSGDGVPSGAGVAAGAVSDAVTRPGVATDDMVDVAAPDAGPGAGGAVGLGVCASPSAGSGAGTSTPLPTSGAAGDSGVPPAAAGAGFGAGVDASAPLAAAAAAASPAVQAEAVAPPSAGVPLPSSAAPPHANGNGAADDDSDGEQLPPAGGTDNDLWDDDADDADAAWVKQRTGGLSGLPSDAILSCPFCFTILTYLSQQHERYENQFRAIIVQNCVVRRGEQLVFPLSNAAKRRRGGGGRGQPRAVDSAAPPPDPEDVFNPVCCKQCGTEVGVVDSDDVYHFCDVFPNPS